jgi:hypothetical protein
MLDYFPHMSVFHQERTGFDHHWTRILCIYSAGVCFCFRWFRFISFPFRWFRYKIAYKHNIKIINSFSLSFLPLKEGVSRTNTFVVLRLVTNVALIEGARVAQWVRSLDLTAQQAYHQYGVGSNKFYINVRYANKQYGIPFRTDDLTVSI